MADIQFIFLKTTSGHMQMDGWVKLALARLKFGELVVAITPFIIEMVRVHAHSKFSSYAFSYVRVAQKYISVILHFTT